ncbi:hypothetical protein LOZ80_25725 [Paenibacillus sp. HWE-109]|uniref:hypothetical protein n=1 Tax=Paenibacillus sp. HWE-109 TaxID=1306526 RepID=UPI001EE07EFC|nr:hypothetical protein [Paenibacillus sp. HWE-109]UKS24980.1 hypothetical protein LOZ80_25725 [Paenibacillus sp. HWE-109]
MVSANALATDEQKPDVIFAVINNHEQYVNKFVATVQVNFLSPKFKNDDVYMSYHIYVGNKEVLFEGKRKPLSHIADNLYYSDFEIDMSSIKGAEKNAVIVFDLVDQKNAYWFLQNPNIVAVSDEIHYNEDKVKGFFYFLKTGIKSNLPIFIVNLVCFLATIFFLIRKKINSYKR